MITLADIDAEIARRQAPNPAINSAPQGITLADIDAEIARRQVPAQQENIPQPAPQAQALQQGFVPPTTAPDLTNQAQPAAQEQDFISQINDFILSSPGGPEVAEFGAAVSRGVTGLADFFINKPANAALNLVGSESRVPLLTDKASAATTGNFLEDGLKKDIIRGAGEAIPAAIGAGGALRSAAEAIPAIATTSQTLGANITKQLGSTTAIQDLGFAAASGAGSEIGREVAGDAGAIAGALLAPIGAIGAIEAGKKGIKIISNSNVANNSKNAITDLIGIGRVGVEKIVKPANNISEDGAGIILAEQMVREGKTPEQVIEEFSKLGPNAIPADLSESFARTLRVAADRFPIVSGGARNLFNARNAKSGNRLLNAFDDASGTSSLNLGDEIKRLDDVLGPKINDLYNNVRGQSLKLSPKLKLLLNGDTSIGSARRKAEQGLIDRKEIEPSGKENIQIIDATKQQMDDEIGTAVRSGAQNRASRLIQLKNKLVEEADAAIPIYKKARDLYAGKKSLESAGDLGIDFFKIKASEMPNLVKSMGESERNVFLLGAKKAILDKVDKIGVNRNEFNALFGKNGDLKKLRFLFGNDNQKGFEKFVNIMETEGNFRLTDALIRGNSTTNRQLQESFQQGLTFRKALPAVENLLNPFAIRQNITRILNKLEDNKQEEEFANALQEAANILTAKGMSPDKLFGILTRKDNKEIEKALRKFSSKKNAKGFEPAALTEILTESN